MFASVVRMSGASSGGVRGERMPGQVEAERRLLVREALGVGPVARRHERDRGPRRFLAEQRHLRGARLGALRRVERDADRCEQRGASRLDRVERAGSDQRLDHAAVDGRLSTRRQKSNRSRNGPPDSRAATMASIACSPVPLMPPSP